MMSRVIGIMQGRLTPPIGNRIQAFPADRWREEFPLAAQVRLGCIEWIYETYGHDQNPLCTDAGLAELRSLSERHGVTVRSVCADYFMEQPLIRAEGAELRRRSEHLRWLISRCAAAGIRRIVLPFVDASEIRTSEDEPTVVDVLTEVEQIATVAGVELHLETSLAPRPFAALLDRLPGSIRVNYDTGNSASLGYSPTDEFAAYGDRIGSVHIKDRLRGGTTVPLGTGSADFAAFSAAVRRVQYAGDLILQAARGVMGQELQWAQSNLHFVTEGLG